MLLFCSLEDIPDLRNHILTSAYMYYHVHRKKKSRKRRQVSWLRKKFAEKHKQNHNEQYDPYEGLRSACQITARATRACRYFFFAWHYSSTSRPSSLLQEHSSHTSNLATDAESVLPFASKLGPISPHPL